MDLPEEKLRWFFDKAGVSETQLNDQETRMFIYDFIIKNGGADAVNEDLTDEPPPPYCEFTYLDLLGGQTFHIQLYLSINYYKFI